MLAALLRALGHEVRTAYDGTAALKAANEDHPEVVMLDIGLPGKNGYEVAQEMRRTLKPQPLALVAFTGYGQDEDRRRVRNAGFDHHLVKPVDPAALERIIESLSETPGR
jgi:CheY-like chemotaxis protein